MRQNGTETECVVRQRQKKVQKKREGDIRQAVDMTLLIKGLYAYPHCLWYMFLTYVSYLAETRVHIGVEEK